MQGNRVYVIVSRKGDRSKPAWLYKANGDYYWVDQGDGAVKLSMEEVYEFDFNKVMNSGYVDLTTAGMYECEQVFIANQLVNKFIGSALSSNVAKLKWQQLLCVENTISDNDLAWLQRTWSGLHTQLEIGRDDIDVIRNTLNSASSTFINTVQKLLRERNPEVRVCCTKCGWKLLSTNICPNPECK